MDTTPLKIESCQPSDLYKLRWSVLRPNEPTDKNVHYNGDYNPESLHLKATFKGQIIGCVSIFPDSTDHLDENETQYRIRALAVTQKFQHNGVGRKLMEKASIECNQRSSLFWLSGRSHHLNFYKSLGFQPIGTEFEIKGTGPHYIFVNKST
jgi:predicted GNAT family N-acyltransferase